jgi:hypothetical protein
MGFRFGAMIGFGVGYYFGAKAGRERYVQLQRTIEKLRSSPTVEQATVKAKDAATAAVDKAKTFADEHRPGHSPNGQPIPMGADS